MVLESGRAKTGMLVFKELTPRPVFFLYHPLWQTAVTKGQVRDWREPSKEVGQGAEGVTRT